MNMETGLIQPVNMGPAVGSNGLFCLALDIRGMDLMVDMYEDPEFAHAFLRKVAEWYEILEKAWSFGAPLFPFDITDNTFGWMATITGKSQYGDLVEGANKYTQRCTFCKG